VKQGRVSKVGRVMLEEVSDLEEASDVRGGE